MGVVKKIILVVFLLFFCVIRGGVVFAATDNCVDVKNLKCYQVSAVLTPPSLIPAEGPISFVTKPPNIVLTEEDKNYLIKIKTEGGVVTQYYACYIPPANLPTGVIDSDSYSICKGFKNTDNSYSYLCAVGDYVMNQILPSCNYGSGSGQTTAAAVKEVGTLAESAPAIDASGYYNGSVTCGDRTFQCTKGGWFADVSTACYCCGSCTPDDLFVVANTFLRWLFGIIGAIGLAMFVWGGFKWVTSAGDSGSVTEGRNAMKNVVIGLVIMFSAGAVVLLIQNKIGINSEVKISVTGGSTGSSSSSSTTQTPAATKDTVTYGNLAMGSSCNVRQDTKSSDCSEGMNCYGIKDNPNLKGVCLAINPKGSSKAGEDCWLLNNGEGDTCAVGTCKVDSGDTTPGTRGKCWTQEEINQFMDNTICSGDSQCAKGFKCVSSRCVISESSNAGRGEVCRVLPGSSTNDCTSTFKCFTDLNNLSASRNVGDVGKCAYNQSLAEWKDCLGNVECKTGYVCKPFNDKNYCVSKNLAFDVAAGKSCVKFTIDGGAFDNCALSLDCYYGKTTDKSGICVPPNPVNSVGKNQECYLLPGSAKMCTGDLNCVSYVSGSYKTTAGSKGLCFPPDGTIDENQQCFYLPGRNMCKTNLVCDVGFLPKTFGNPGICKKK